MDEINNCESQIYRIKNKYLTENRQKKATDLDDPNILQDEDYRINGSFGVTDYTYIYSIPREVEQILGW
jgi:hypothetical protein